MAERISVKKAAELTGLSELTIRLGIKCGSLEFGRAIPSKSGKQHTYHISPKKLEEYLGMQKELNKEIDPGSVIDTKIKLLEDEVQQLKSNLHELSLVINGLLDNQEYLIKRLNGEKVKGYSTTFSSTIMNFRKKPVYDIPEEKVTVKRTAELLGVSPIVIHLGIIHGEFPFGTVTQKVQYNGNHQNVYHINARKLAEYLGITIEQVKGTQ